VGDQAVDESWTVLDDRSNRRPEEALLQAARQHQQSLTTAMAYAHDTRDRSVVGRGPFCQSGAVGAPRAAPHQDDGEPRTLGGQHLLPVGLTARARTTPSGVGRRLRAKRRSAASSANIRDC